MFSEPGPQSAPPLIRRTQITSDLAPPWEGISFTQPVGSDRLSDELRRAYPGCLDLRQRKHMAAIEFLQHELIQMQSSNPATNVVESGYPATPEGSSPSNDNFDGRSRQSSTSVSQSAFQRGQTWSDGNLHQIESQTPTSSIVRSSQQIVFSVSDGHTLQPTTRRTMTREEKMAYRKTRKRGACSTCRRQKGKCTHVGGSLPASRITENTTKLQKRYSLDVSADQDKPEKLLKSAHAVPNTELIVAPQSQHGITNTSGIATEFHTVQPPTRDPIHSHWEQATDQGAESDAARSSPPSLIEDPTSTSCDSPVSTYTSATSIKSHYTAA